MFAFWRLSFWILPLCRGCLLDWSSSRGVLLRLAGFDSFRAIQHDHSEGEVQVRHGEVERVSLKETYGTDRSVAVLTGVDQSLLERVLGFNGPMVLKRSFAGK